AARNSSAGDGRPLVPSVLPHVLGAEGPATLRTTRDRSRYPGAHPEAQPGQSTMGDARIDSELRKLGIKVSPTTVAKYRVWQRHPPSPPWRSFLRNHARDLVAADFSPVPTATFQVLFVCVILAHHRRPASST